jgi:hypothetical protein
MGTSRGIGHSIWGIPCILYLTPETIILWLRFATAEEWNRGTELGLHERTASVS